MKNNFCLKFNLNNCKKISFVSLIALLFLSLNIEVHAQGNLLINPRRLVFEGNKKSAELNIANTGKDTARYVISVMELRMKEDGSFETITEPDSGQNFASKYLRFFPRNVVLGPNEAQVIKVQLRNTSQMQPGEYRSHIYFRAVPNEAPLGEAPKQVGKGSISVQLVPIFGITIPAIIKLGESTTKVTLSDISIKVVNDTITKLSVLFNRQGNMSSYGDLTVDYISPEGKVTRICNAKGLAVYTPNEKRRFEMEIDKKNHLNYHTGSLKAVYSSQADESKIFAEKTINLN